MERNPEYKTWCGIRAMLNINTFDEHILTSPIPPPAHVYIWNRVCEWGLLIDVPQFLFTFRILDMKFRNRLWNSFLPYVMCITPILMPCMKSAIVKGFYIPSVLLEVKSCAFFVNCFSHIRQPNKMSSIAKGIGMAAVILMTVFYLFHQVWYFGFFPELYGS